MILLNNGNLDNIRNSTVFFSFFFFFAFLIMKMSLNDFHNCNNSFYMTTSFLLLRNPLPQIGFTLQILFPKGVNCIHVLYIYYFDK